MTPPSLCPHQPLRHLYVHIPFCPKICPYCSFYKTTLDADLRERFTLALENEIRRAANALDLQPRTLFFGGGTPTSLTIAQLRRIGQTLQATCDLSHLEEWTIEMNPATVSYDKARALLEMGVTRISMGVQSWDSALLQTLGRVHSAEEARESFTTLRKAGVENLNLDLIFAIPGQTRATWFASLGTTIALQPEHIAAYSLSYEEDTEFLRRLEQGEYTVDHDLDADLFQLTMERLESGGYAQYEISNYARPGFECRHNFAYWRGADYLGLGPSAVSTLGTVRRTNAPDTVAYVEALERGESAPHQIEPLSAELRQRERLSFGLRTREGLAENEVEPWMETFREYEAQGWVRCSSSGRWSLTVQGRMLADALAEVFW